MRLQAAPDDEEGGCACWKYVYEHYDCVVCPEYQILRYSTTNWEGYRDYKSGPKICAKCPTRALCTKAKNCEKTMQRHIWKEYKELANNARYTLDYIALYEKREETIERAFADAKEKHAMRYTRDRDSTRVANWEKLKFTAMNLEKLDRWWWQENCPP